MSVRLRWLAVLTALLPAGGGCGAGHKAAPVQPKRVPRIVFARDESIWVVERAGLHNRYRFL
ncbi:MAG: hypothetical protein QOE29_1144, partial [Gaiellaceae bacterium]|nr:hypothetical protein [Gaiellaceae bacterium]